MAKIVRAYKEELPTLTLLGKLYGNENRNDEGTFSSCWREWFANGWFASLESCGTPLDKGAYVGAMRLNNGVFEYRIGVLLTAVETVPEGFTVEKLPAASYGVTWIKGKDDAELYSMHKESMSALSNEGFCPAKDAWYIERYSCPRFTVPDENGEVILDYLVTLEK